VDDVAREAFYSQFHFTHVFLGLTDETPGAYLRKRRLEEADNALMGTGFHTLA
jgi:AraC-like DNA-binding protein